MFPQGSQHRGQRPKWIPYFEVPADCQLEETLSHAERRKAYAELRGLGIPAYAVRKYLRYPGAQETAKRLEAMPATRDALAKLQDELGLHQQDVLAGLLEAVRRAENAAELLACWREIAWLLGFYRYYRLRKPRTRQRG